MCLLGLLTGGCSLLLKKFKYDIGMIQEEDLLLEVVHVLLILGGMSISVCVLVYLLIC